MVAGVTASLVLRMIGSLVGSDVAGAAPTFEFDETLQRNFKPGTAAVNEANVLYRATRQIAASGNEDLDLAGVLANALGATIAAAEIVAVVIEADEANTNDVRFGPAASAGALLGFLDASDRVAVAPGDFLVHTCRRGWAVTATSADKVNVANSGSGTVVNYTITLFGRTVVA